MDLQKVSFKMPIDDVFELNEFMEGVFVTGHIEVGNIKPGASVVIVDNMGDVQISAAISGIISQGSIPTMKKKMLKSASEFQDDYWGVALIFDNKEVRDCAQSGMFVVMP